MYQLFAMNKKVLNVLLLGFLLTAEAFCADVPDLRLQQSKENGRLGCAQMLAEEAAACGLGEVLGLAVSTIARKASGNKNTEILTYYAALVGGYQLSRCLFCPGRILEKKLLDENNRLQEMARKTGASVVRESLITTSTHDSSLVTNSFFGSALCVGAHEIAIFAFESLANFIYPPPFSPYIRDDAGYNRVFLICLSGIASNTILNSLMTKYLYDPEGDRRCALATQNEQLRAAILKKTLAGHNGRPAGGITLHV